MGWGKCHTQWNKGCEEEVDTPQTSIQSKFWKYELLPWRIQNTFSAAIPNLFVLVFASYSYHRWRTIYEDRRIYRFLWNGRAFRRLHKAIKEDCLIWLYKDSDKRASGAITIYLLNRGLNGIPMFDKHRSLGSPPLCTMHLLWPTIFNGRWTLIVLPSIVAAADCYLSWSWWGPEI